MKYINQKLSTTQPHIKIEPFFFFLLGIKIEPQIQWPYQIPYSVTRANSSEGIVTDYHKEIWMDLLMCTIIEIDNKM